ncbi:hypothetical protein FV226_23765 [Methylobacterium sp. WL12]|uniref:hypothetical protein n=1 Tax=Methylobacterium sp. WL12 TaxID=2603890 RepID=UPI0011C916BE|nr:hypothetical protein [Methylobacterium sp. WL12]TXM66295.1 hypothetical protein FV226_23765 [Methylobacterium sp. WL12]
MSLIHNERTKLSATWLNSIAAAAVAVGGIAPSIAAVTGTLSPLLAAGLVLFWFLVGAGLHFTARAILGRLRDTP